jgi:ribosomal protein L24E
VYRESILRVASKNALRGERIALVSPNSLVNVIFCGAGFRPGRRGWCLVRPDGRNYHLMRLEERNLCVEQKGPKPLTPRLASFREDGRQLAEGGPTSSAQTRLASG